MRFPEQDLKMMDELATLLPYVTHCDNEQIQILKLSLSFLFLFFI